MKILLLLMASSVVLPNLLHAGIKPAEENPYAVTWNETAASADDSVPLGNGEVGVNAWINDRGVLDVLISRTDAWDEWGRQVKVGGVQIDLTNGGFSEKESGSYTQTLDVRTGQLTARLGEPGYKVGVRLWVDAHRPVIVVEIDADAAVSPVVRSNLWRVPGNLVLDVTRDVATAALTMQPQYEITPDTRLAGSQRLAGQIGWYHANGEKPAYDEVMKTQGTDQIRKDNPLKDRIFGAIVRAENAQARDDATLRLSPATRHVIEIAVETLNPSTPEQWLAHTQGVIEEAGKTDVEERRRATASYWRALYDKSYIHVTKAGTPPGEGPLPAGNPFYLAGPSHLSIGMDNKGGSVFAGTLADVRIVRGNGDVLFKADSTAPRRLEESAGWSFPDGGTFEISFTLSTGHSGYRRLLDKIEPGGADGFLVDVTPQRQIRFIHGTRKHVFDGKVPPDAEVRLSLSFSPYGKVRLFRDGTLLYDEADEERGDAFLVTRAYALQRYVNACGGRGAFPITFNGSIFTVPVDGRSEHADYRRWGAGYWWQNTRLPYYSMHMAGDFDLALPLYEMYASMLPLCRYRTQTYLNCDGAYFAECMYFWGDVFPRTYGTTPWRERSDRLQDSRWHKYEWDCGIEVSCMALDYYLFTGDDTFARRCAVPLGDALVRFFNSYYRDNDAAGRLVMAPSQALETWWDCTNPASLVAGLTALTDKLLSLPETVAAPGRRQAWEAFRKRLPPLPVDTASNGDRKLAPASRYDKKSNVEVPELYAVFPYRICSFDRPELLDEAKNALKHRRDRGAFGWRQEDLFMAYLGETEQAKDYLLQRIRDRHHGWQKGMPRLKFPGFWGPGYDWLPDQCHGGVVAATIQNMVMQTSGKAIFLFPAFPKEWNVEFKLHAPYRTVVEGTLKEGRLTRLVVTPESRRKDVVLCGGVRE